jgi:hypothetical protein
LVGGLFSLCIHHASWLRDLQTWEPAGDSAWLQFASLARHLFATSPVTAFMTYVWLEGCSGDGLRHQSWFKHLGLGYGIRGVQTPIRLTKIMARHFLQAPDHCSVNQAIRWGQVRGLGAEESLANAIVATRLGRSFEHDQYWSQVVRFLIDHPDLGIGDVGPIIEYLDLQHRFCGQAALEALARKRSDELLLQVKRWRATAPVVRGLPGSKWKPCGISGFDRMERRRQGNFCQWAIRELLDSNELLEEGRQMRHCVGRYARRCRNGVSSIWSLTRSDRLQQCRRELTIEVDPRKGEVVQARGMRDARPASEARRVMLLWAAQEGLNVRSWV